MAQDMQPPMSSDIASLIMQFRPSKDTYQTMPENDLLDRVQSAISTAHYWKIAHAQNTLHHQNFPGYCPICTPVLNSNS